VKTQEQMERIVALRQAWTCGYQAARIGVPCRYSDDAMATEWRKGHRQYGIDQATEHPYECRCDLCKAWWAAMPPEE